MRKEKEFVVKPWLSKDKVDCVCCKDLDFGGHHMYGVDESEKTNDFVSDAIYQIVHNKGARKIRIIVLDIGEAEQGLHQTQGSLRDLQADSTPQPLASSQGES